MRRQTSASLTRLPTSSSLYWKTNGIWKALNLRLPQEFNDAHSSVRYA